MFFRISSVGEVLFGRGSISDLRGVVDSLGGGRVLVVTGKTTGRTVVRRRVIPVLQGLEVDVFDHVPPEPGEDVVEGLRAVMRSGEYSVVIGVGGGSVLDVAKISACTFAEDRPLESYAGTDISHRSVGLILCPTTAGTGSEVTNLAVIELKDMGIKHVFEGRSMYADFAVVDPDLTLTLPRSVTVSSGLDALCHGIESLVSLRASPFTELLSISSVERIGRNIASVAENGGDEVRREEMSLASLFAGIAFNNAGTVLGHALGYAHSHIHRMPHGISVAVTMPYVLQFNAVACPEKHATIARLLGADVDGVDVRDAALMAGRKFADLLSELGVPSNLSELGVEESMVPEIVERVFMSSKHVIRNPRPVSREELGELVRRAIRGDLS